MQQIRINDGLYEALGETGARELARLFEEKGLTGVPVEIVGDREVAVPDMNSTVFGMDYSEAFVHALEGSDVAAEFKIKLPIKIPSFVCKAGCDAAAAAAAASLTLTGPALAAALAAIAVARDACRSRC